VIVPPVAEYDTAGVVDERSPDVTVTANWLVPPGARVMLTGSRLKPSGGGSRPIGSPGAQPESDRTIASGKPDSVELNRNEKSKGRRESIWDSSLTVRRLDWHGAFRGAVAS
jgi:hypothetical protein